MAQKKQAGETKPIEDSRAGHVRRLGENLMYQVEQECLLRLVEATKLSGIAHLANTALHESLSARPEDIVKTIGQLHKRLGEIIAACTHHALAVQPDDYLSRIAREYFGDLMYIAGTGAVLPTTSTGPRGGFYREHENITWIRGHHAPNSAAVKALIENFAKERKPTP